MASEKHISYYYHAGSLAKVGENTVRASIVTPDDDNYGATIDVDVGIQESDGILITYGTYDSRKNTDNTYSEPWITSDAYVTYWADIPDDCEVDESFVSQIQGRARWGLDTWVSVGGSNGYYAVSEAKFTTILVGLEIGGLPDILWDTPPAGGLTKKDGPNLSIETCGTTHTFRFNEFASVLNKLEVETTRSDDSIYSTGAWSHEPQPLPIPSVIGIDIVLHIKKKARTVTAKVRQFSDFGAIFGVANTVQVTVEADDRSVTAPGNDEAYLDNVSYYDPISLSVTMPSASDVEDPRYADAVDFIGWFCDSDLPFTRAVCDLDMEKCLSTEQTFTLSLNDERVKTREHIYIKAVFAVPADIDGDLLCSVLPEEPYHADMLCDEDGDLLFYSWRRNADMDEQ